MRFYNYLQENDRIVEAIVYKRSLKKRHLLQLNVEEFVANLHRLESSYLVGILNSEETLFYKLEFPKSLKKNLKYLQIENYAISRLEESGLSSQEYSFFFKEYPSREKKGFVTVFLYILPKRIIEQEMPVNELYLLYDFFIELAQRSSNEELYAVVHYGHDLITSMVFYHREMQILNISYRSVPFESGMLRELVQDKLGLDLKEEQIFIFGEDRFPKEYFDFLKQGKIGKQLAKLHEAYPQVNVALLFPLVFRAKPIIEKEPIRIYLSPEDNKRFIYALSFLVLALASGLSWEYMRYYQLSKRFESLGHQLAETQEQIERNKMEQNQIAISSTNYIKTIKKLPYPLFIEGSFLIEREVQGQKGEVVSLQIQNKNSSSRGRKKKRLKPQYQFVGVFTFPNQEAMEHFEQAITKVPLFKKIHKEIVVNREGQLLTFYKIELEELNYAT
ncbi:MAG: hypothetical protein GXO38_00245 [Epsilonproteobacteria bacterium]|nr:hypothetical protein [Campylobacterota bacterium]